MKWAIIGFILGAIAMYMFLWFQAFNTLEGVLCNITTKPVAECVRER